MNDVKMGIWQGGGQKKKKKSWDRLVQSLT